MGGIERAPNGLVTGHDGYPPISDYAVIGDTRTAALVSRDGAVEWLCLPIFDSPSVFAALLDRQCGGRWVLRPRGAFDVERRYAAGTNVLETTYRTATGSARVDDAFILNVPWEGKRLAPEHELVRVIDGLTGTIDFEMVFEPRPNYARETARLIDRGAFGIRLELGNQSVSLLADFPVVLSGDCSSASGSLSIAAGERRALSLVSDRTAPAVLPPVQNVEERLRATSTWWKRWSDEVDYVGPYRDAVVRSALALKTMTFSPSGAIIAAPTTSLPEVLGGSANWDYRYCWLRDAAFTIRALYGVGHDAEAESFLAWLLHATRVTLPELHAVYDVYGESRLSEADLALDGYAGSRPVRVGNGAAGQFQLDVYGELIDAAVSFVDRGGTLDAAQRRMLARLGETVCRRWEEPDHGIWELRGDPRHYTHSKMLAWVALDRLLRLADRGQCEIDRELVASNHSRLGSAIEERGFNEHLGAYAATFDGDTVDAGLLSGFLHGYADWSSPRVAGTISRIDRVLGAEPLVHRFSDDRGESEGTFAAAAFWFVECLVRVGQRDPARRRFESLLEYANDIGLFAEEIDAGGGGALGNFPQALTHVGLINAAVALEES